MLKSQGNIDDRNGFRQPGLVGHILWNLEEVGYHHDLSAKEIEDTEKICELWPNHRLTRNVSFQSNKDEIL